jgi:hypothetical protein
MANWCENKLVITGDTNEVEKFIKNGISEDGSWEFENYYPTPYSLTEGDNWYYWRAENWGTKWNPDDVCISANTIEFLTAYSPPVSWIVKVSEEYPNLIFKLTFIEEEGFAGLCEIQDGDCIRYEEGEVCYVDEDGTIYSRSERQMDGDAYSILNPFELD